MQNINPSNNVNRRGRFYALMGLFVCLGGLIASALGVLLFLLPLLGESLSTPAGLCFNVVGIPMALVGIGLMFRGFTLKKDNTIAFEVGEAMRPWTDNRYTYIRNISRRKLGYIDAVLVGPPGALVLRTVEYPGEWINERVEWRYRNKQGKLRAAPNNPTRECAHDVYALRKFLAERRLAHVPVYGVVVFANENVRLKGQGPVIPIAEKHTLFQILSRDYLKEERLKLPQVRATVDALIE
jgi:hypothetical protein